MDKYIRINGNLKKQLKIKSAEQDTNIKSLAETYILQGLNKEEENIIKISVNKPSTTTKK